MLDFLFYQEDIPSKGYHAGDLKLGYSIAALALCFLAMAYLEGLDQMQPY
jgi:hypothetical protein